ncbi:conserved Plasmodium protein, unknown function [Plasmodium malariae]|uniref:Macro domain-containing protein n=1 Tax=Plasmodium malariae TaxID=5858 RepID=A0A1C3KA58_PLAMA|nr:conserved Plasmodium protein, unknown function [Plasmodium malariae]
MSIGEKFNEALYWLKEELDEILKEVELEKSEIILSEICTKINEKMKSMNSSESLDLYNEKAKEPIEHANLISWQKLNYCIFHYVHLYNKIHEKLLIEEDDFYFTFDSNNYYVRKKFKHSLAFHPLVYTIDAAYFNLLFSFISGGVNRDGCGIDHYSDHEHEHEHADEDEHEHNNSNNNNNNDGDDYCHCCSVYYSDHDDHQNRRALVDAHNGNDDNPSKDNANRGNIFDHLSMYKCSSNKWCGNSNYITNIIIDQSLHKTGCSTTERMTRGDKIKKKAKNEVHIFEQKKEKKKKKFKKVSKCKIKYIYNDDIKYKQNFIITEESYASLSERFPKIFDITKYIERNTQMLYNFGVKKQVEWINSPSGKEVPADVEAGADVETRADIETRADVEAGADVVTRADVETIAHPGEVRSKCILQPTCTRNNCARTGLQLLDENHAQKKDMQLKGEKNKRRRNVEEKEWNKNKTYLNDIYTRTVQNNMYTVEPNMNEKIKVYNGDITSIRCNAIVLFANNNYKYSKNVCENLYSSNLMKLEEEEKLEIKMQKSGEVYITTSYDSIHKYILHAMLPKYNSKFVLATHNTMNLCVQEILYRCFEKQIQSISIPVVSFHLFFPINIFLITLLKSIRSLLIQPHFYNTVKTIVLVTNSNDIYFLLLKYMSIFFPRCSQESFLSTNIAILGNKFGSIDVQNRSIPIFRSFRRVMHMNRGSRTRRRRRHGGRYDSRCGSRRARGCCSEHCSADDNNIHHPSAGDAAFPEWDLKKRHSLQNGPVGGNYADLSYSSCSSYMADASHMSYSSSATSSYSSATSSYSSASSFCSPSSISSSSEIFKEADAEFLNLRSENEGHKNFFNLNQINRGEDTMNLECCLRLSYMYDKKEKFKELKDTYFVYDYGFDELGRNTIIINFFNFPLVYNYNLLFFYLIFYFNIFMRNHFVLLFIFSEKISSNITKVLSLFKDIFQVIQEFLKNLKIIYFFNYSLIFKFFIYILYPFIPSTIYENIIYLNDNAVKLEKK